MPAVGSRPASPQKIVAAAPDGHRDLRYAVSDTAHGLEPKIRVWCQTPPDRLASADDGRTNRPVWGRRDATANVPGGLEFLLSRNRLNVAIEQMRLANALCRSAEPAG
jgi:hypothetical protein